MASRPEDEEEEEEREGKVGEGEGDWRPNEAPLQVINEGVVQEEVQHGATEEGVERLGDDPLRVKILLEALKNHIRREAGKHMAAERLGQHSDLRMLGTEQEDPVRGGGGRWRCVKDGDPDSPPNRSKWTTYASEFHHSTAMGMHRTSMMAMPRWKMIPTNGDLGFCP